MQKISIDASDARKRIDVLVTEKISKLNRSMVKKLIDDSIITLNNQTIKPGYRVSSGDIISINIDIDQHFTVPSIELPIIYEDINCIVINKPPGVLTHSKGAFNPEPTVASFISKMISSDMSSERAGIVHRLDRATSGVIICAKNIQTQDWLQKQFSMRKTTKIYYAVVTGELQQLQATIEMPIERDKNKPKQFKVGTNGKPAKTNYKVLKSNGIYSLLELTPITGRTHQLRVHLNQIGHPIVGDKVYGGQDFKRMLLHAYKLSLYLPGNKFAEFSAPLPNVFKELL
jgi:23S rRNA pseudouridine1911/1915/1917 synthase